jgi:uncharacterized membrane protein YgdD (TMEM256/DUF423 family)
MQKLFFIIGTILAGLSVALGAFGAHGLKKIVAPEVVATYQTGVQYQIYHAFAILIVALMLDRWVSSYLHYAGFCFLAGVVLFSGSLYLITSFYARNASAPTAIGILTPIGGLFFILGWVLLLLGVLKK